MFLRMAEPPPIRLAVRSAFSDKARPLASVGSNGVGLNGDVKLVAELILVVLGHGAISVNKDRGGNYSNEHKCGFVFM